MAEITQAARDYLTALEKKRQSMGVKEGNDYVANQKKIASSLAGDDSKMQTVAQNRLRNSAAKRRAKDQFEAISTAKNTKPTVKKIPGNVKRNDDPVMVRKRTPQTVGSFFKDTFNGQGPFKPVSEDKKAQNAADQKAYEAANAARAARRKK